MMRYDAKNTGAQVASRGACSGSVCSACLAVLALFGSAAAEDWPTYMHDNRRSGVSAQTLPLEDLEQAWVYYSPSPPQMAWDGGHPWDSYAGNMQVPMRDFDTAFFVSAVGDLVYFGSSVTDSVHCLDARTGKEEWFFHTDGPVRYPPSFDDGRLYFTSDDGYAYCINAADGAFVWKYSPSHDDRLIGNNGSLIPMWPIRTGAAVMDGKAYFAASLAPWEESYLCAVDASTGSATGPGLYVTSGGSTPMSAILVSSTKIYLAQGRRYPSVYHRSSGAFCRNVGSRSGDGGCYVLLTSDTGYAYAHGLDHGTGYRANEYADHIATYPNGKRMIVSGQTAYVITEQLSVDVSKNDRRIVNARLSAFDRGSGGTVWSVACDSPCYSLILAGDVLFAGGTNKVTAHEISSGEELWSRAVHGRARGLAAANGKLFVSTDTGNIHMFGNIYLPGDLNHDGLFNLLDLAVFADDYLKCTDPANKQGQCENLRDN
ncbi:MAG: PQQ-binding-like beta-propeller repeat protein [Phycisphaerales bacterium]|nr:MAG: PQQ-binding-like beta-propeller repeat protein [Phycisphaerales bacterium]